MPKIHIVKSWPVNYEAVEKGRKKAEIRLLDRDYSVGDYIVLRKFDPASNLYSGDWIGCLITHIDSDARYGIQQGYGVLSISPLVQGDRYDVADFEIASDGKLNVMRMLRGS